MKKPRGNAPACLMLPVDVVMKIAFAIPDADDFFAFLEVLISPLNNLGPLEPLHQLGKSVDHEDLWPTLCLGSSTPDTSSRSSFEAITKLYLHVAVDDTCDAQWLLGHLNSMATVEWTINRLSAINELPDGWFDLPITRLIVNCGYDTTTGWKDLLERLSHLTSLAVHNGGDVDVIFEFLATSNQIREFQIANEFMDMTESNQINLTKWLLNQPVRVFECSSGDWYNRDDAIYRAMFNCSTLDRLMLSSWDLSNVDFTHLMFEMQTLELHNSFWDSNLLKSLASRLEGSKVIHLQLHGNLDDTNFAGIESLLRVLPQTRIKSLELTSLSLSDANWCKFAHRIEKCTLDKLLLRVLNWSSTVAGNLANAIRNNQTICEFDLDSSNLSIHDLRLLIESMAHSNRSVRRKRGKIISSVWRLMTGSTAKSLKEFAANCGCTFVHKCNHKKVLDAEMLSILEEDDIV
ncbi:hypothetical protein AeNC1_012300 [Aphanomyces euteiches]|nr:hypothetical protein AeNC1_012300 [Aphanomyces euteiches]